jgi:catechol 2,3-dioxygenase
MSEGSRETGTGAGVRPPGYRLPAATRPGPVRLDVASLDRSIAYYRELIGLQPIREGGGKAELGAGDDVLVVLREVSGVRVLPRRAAALACTTSRSSFRTVRRWAASSHTSRRKGCGPARRITRSARRCTSTIPTGWGSRSTPTGRGAIGRSRGGELRMTTEPLDMAGLIGAGGGAGYDGMPAGTRIGHLHLHVGDLREADRFYHAALGLDRMVWSYPGALFLAAGGYHHHLGVNTWAASAEPAADGDARLAEWSLLLPCTSDVETAADSLRSAGIGVEARADGSVSVRDPWGTMLRLAVEPG